jgi:hypothetical protein
MLCLLIAIFGLSLAFIVGFSRSERTHYNEYSTEHFSIPQDSMATVEVGKFRVVRVEDDDFADFNMNNDNCSFRLIPTPVGTGLALPFLQIPESIKNCIDVSSVDDTLFIYIRMRDVLQNIDSKRNNFVSGLNLTLAAERVDVVNNFQRLKTVVEEFDADTVAVIANYISIRRCRAKIVDTGTAEHLHLWDSRIGTVSVDLDVTHDYRIENSEIDVENLTGSGYNDLRTITAKTLNWKPKDVASNLHLLITGDTTTVMLKR